MHRRDLLKGFLAMPLAAAELYAQRTRGLPPLLIKEVQVIPTSAGGAYGWVFIKIITSEPGLYGIGSASNAFQTFAVVESIRKHLAPFWLGKNAWQIEDLWQQTNVRSYWRNSTVINNALSGLDMALWDIKGKRAGMPVYELLGGKVRDAVPVYAHADGSDLKAVEDSVRRYMEEGFRYVRAQMGGYGGGGFDAPSAGHRVEGGCAGPAFDEDVYVKTITEMFEHLRNRLGWNVKLLHDVHERITLNQGINLCIAFGPTLLKDVTTDVPHDFRPFETIKSIDGSGREAKGTQEELLFWMNGPKKDQIWKIQWDARQALKGHMKVARETMTFIYGDSLDMTGFIDGTGNPEIERDREVAIVPDGQPGAGAVRPADGVPPV
jgi:hypothetical protein